MADGGGRPRCEVAIERGELALREDVGCRGRGPDTLIRGGKLIFEVEVEVEAVIMVVQGFDRGNSWGIVDG